MLAITYSPLVRLVFAILILLFENVLSEDIDLNDIELGWSLKRQNEAFLF